MIPFIDCVKRFPPNIQPIIAPEQIQQGDSLRLFCSIIKGSLPLNFMWRHKDKIVRESENRIQIENASPYTSVLVLNSIESEDDGNYSCSVSNSEGTDSSSVLFNVQGPPTWIQQPHDLLLTKHEFVRIDCAAKGNPEPTIQWFKLNGNSLVFMKNFSSIPF